MKGGTKKGFYDHGRVVFDKVQENVMLRTNGLFQANHYATPDSSGKCHQLSISSLSELPIDMISVFTLDYMHLVCLGVTRRMLYHLKGHYKGIFEGRLSSAQIQEVSNILMSLNGKLPSEFARQPRSLAELDRWKATELRSFLLYSGPVVLKGIVDPKLYKHFLSLSIAIRILCEEDKIKCSSLLDFAKELLNYFVNNAKEHYGNAFCVYNVHGLSHIADDVEYFQLPLDGLSAFQFENFLQTLKRLVRSRHNPVSQITKRLDEIDAFDAKVEPVTKIRVKEKDSCFLTKKGVVFVINKNLNDTYKCQLYSQKVLDSFFDSFINSKELDIYLIRGSVKPTHCTMTSADFIRKCCCIPYKTGNVVVPLLSIVKATS